MENFTLGIVISTYNNPEWLEKTLWGYQYQTRLPDEILIADDGSRPDTRELVERFHATSLPMIKHLWHPDEGFRKCTILNEALRHAESDYLIFTDHDCIPRNDFVEVHHRQAKPGHLLSGGYSKMPMQVSKAISQDDIASGRAFELKWLRAHGLKRSFRNSKLLRSPFFASAMNALTPTGATWNGCNSSGWRKDMLAIKGFDQRMQYGGLDREFGERLINYGIRPIQIRYSAVCLHLDHGRPYEKPEVWNKNRAIRDETRKNRLTQTGYGLE